MDGLGHQPSKLLKWPIKLNRVSHKFIIMLNLRKFADSLNIININMTRSS